jgi:hypothetical protein
MSENRKLPDFSMITTPCKVSAIKNVKRRGNTSTSVRKESSQEETCVKEELKIKGKKIINRKKEEAY